MKPLIIGIAAIGMLLIATKIIALHVKLRYAKRELVSLGQQTPTEDSHAREELEHWEFVEIKFPRARKRWVVFGILLLAATGVFYFLA